MQDTNIEAAQDDSGDDAERNHQDANACYEPAEGAVQADVVAAN
jgi:hypothetical protein